MFDEINPVIVRNLNRKLPEGTYDRDTYYRDRIKELGGEVGATKLEQITAAHAEFIEKYDIAHEAVVNHTPRFDDPIDWEKKQVPLAYRLDIITNDVGRDNIERDKLGGIPDLREQVIGHCTRKTRDYDYKIKCDRYSTKEIKKEYPKGRPKVLPLREGFERVWPKCGCCGRRLRFVGQMDLSVWFNAIHWATKAPRKDWYSEVSALGSSRDVDNELKDGRNLFFYCSCNAFDNTNNDAAIIREHKPLDNGFFEECQRLENRESSIESDEFDILEEVEKQVFYTKAQYLRAARSFMKKHKLNDDDELASDISVQFIDGYDLNFELDDLGYGWHDYNDAIREALPPKSGTYGSDFTLFGAAESQQEPQRYMNQRGYSDPMRQTPILSWCDQGHDFTYQIYGDYRTHDLFAGEMQCKIDGSCT